MGSEDQWWDLLRLMGSEDQWWDLLRLMGSEDQWWDLLRLMGSEDQLWDLLCLMGSGEQMVRLAAPYGKRGSMVGLAAPYGKRGAMAETCCALWEARINGGPAAVKAGVLPSGHPGGFHHPSVLVFESLGLTPLFFFLPLLFVQSLTLSLHTLPLLSF